MEKVWAKVPLHFLVTHVQCSRAFSLRTLNFLLYLGLGMQFVIKRHCVCLKASEATALRSYTNLIIIIIIIII